MPNNASRPMQVIRGEAFLARTGEERNKKSSAVSVALREKLFRYALPKITAICIVQLLGALHMNGFHSQLNLQSQVLYAKLAQPTHSSSFAGWIKE